MDEREHLREKYAVIGKSWIAAILAADIVVNPNPSKGKNLEPRGGG